MTLAEDQETCRGGPCQRGKREDWLLTSLERGNPATVLDERHSDKEAWSTGNQVRPLVHGAVYFAELLAGVSALQAGDSLLFSDWRGDPDELLTGAGSEVARVLCAAAGRGALVYGLMWRSHLDRLKFSERENRRLCDDIEAAGGSSLRDMRVRPGGSHHQKFVVLRHPGRPGLDVAFVGGIDLSHGRHDDAAHAGDAQAQPIAAVYGDRPPWHDIQVSGGGPVRGRLGRESWAAPDRGNPRFPDQDGRLSLSPNIVGHNLALEMLYRGGGDRVRVYGIENPGGMPVYVHAKACIIDTCGRRSAPTTSTGAPGLTTPNSAAPSWTTHSTCVSRTHQADTDSTPAPMRGTCA